jgi:hypothetical protein
MQEKSILLIAAPAPSLQQWAGEAGFQLTWAGDVEQAFELAQQQVFEAVLISLDQFAAEEKKLRALLRIFQPEALLVSFQEADAPRLGSFVKEARREQRKARIRKWLVLDEVGPSAGKQLFPFSAN